MPYIKLKNRMKYNPHLNSIDKIETKGDLEYCVYRLMNKYMEDKDFTYTNLHDVVYATQHCADEFRRRNLDVREDRARISNGDID